MPMFNNKIIKSKDQKWLTKWLNLTLFGLALVTWPVLLSATGSAVTSEEQKHLEPYVIGVELNEYLPFYSPTKLKGYAGIGYDILLVFAKDAQLQVEFKAMTVPDLCNALESGEIDFKFPFDSKWNCPGLDKSTVSQSIGFVPYTDGIMSRPIDLGKNLNKIKALGTVTGFTPVGYNQLIDSGRLQLLEYDKPETLLQKTIEGEVDMAYISIQVADFLLRNQLKSSSALVFNSNFPHQQGYYCLGSKKHPRLIEKFNTWLNKNQRKVKYIVGKYGIHNWDFELEQ